MIYLVLHLSKGVMLGGLIYLRWMYPFEKFLKTIKEYVKYQGMSEGYLVDGTLTFCSMYLQGVETKFNQSNRNLDINTSTTQ